MQLHRTQVLLEPWQHEALRQMSKEQGKSMSQLIREVLGSALRSTTRKDRIMRLAGIGQRPGTDLQDDDAELYDGEL